MVINLNNMKILDASIHRNELHIDFNVRISVVSANFREDMKWAKGNYTKVNFTSENE